MNKQILFIVAYLLCASLVNGSLNFESILKPVKSTKDKYSKLAEKVRSKLHLRELNHVSIATHAHSSPTGCSKDDNKHRFLSKQAIARLSLLGCSTVYGLSYPSTKAIQALVEPEIMILLRFSLASLCFIPTLLRRDRFSRAHIVAGMELGIWCMLGFLAQGFGLKYASASKSALFSSLVVLMPPIFDWVKYKLSPTSMPCIKNNSNNKCCPKAIRRKQLKRLLASLLALSGAAVLEWGGVEEVRRNDILLLITPFTFAMCFWRSEQFATRFPGRSKETTALMLSFVSIFSFLWTLIMNPRLLSKEDQWKPLISTLYNRPIYLLILFFISVIATGWTAVQEQFALKILSAADITLIYTIEPVLAAISAAVFLGEHIGKSTALGAVMIITGCLLGQF